jgi:hypothetical protein
MKRSPLEMVTESLFLAWKEFLGSKAGGELTIFLLVESL